MAIFKNASIVAEKLFSRLDPHPSYLYDGIISDGLQVIAPLKLGDFYCKRCRGKEAFPVLDATIKKTFLSCPTRSCIEANALKPEVKAYLSLKLKDIGVDQEHEEANLANCNQPKFILDQLRLFAHHPKGFLTLAGEAGRGKTFAACACLSAYLNRGGNAFFIRYGEIYQRWLALIQAQSSTQNLFHILDDTPFLVIDDFGSRKPSEAFGDFIFFILDKRKTNTDCGTLLTTNLKSKEITTFFGAPLTSRIVSGKTFELKGSDRRVIENASNS